MSILLVLLALAAAPADDDLVEQDVVYLTDGDTLTGQLVYEDADTVVLRNVTRETSVPREDVLEIDARLHHLDELLDRLAAAGSLERLDDGTLLELARFAEQGRLPGEARLLRLLVLLVDPDHVQANEALGHRERRGGWSLKHEGRWHLTSDLLTMVEDWDDRWRLETAHYDVATNLPLDAAIGAALDLERFYRAFFDVFGRPLRLLEPRERLEVHIHADDASFPEPGDGRRSSFTEDDRIARIGAVRRPWRPRLIHEATRQLLYYLTERARNARGRVPPWTGRGLAVAFSTGLSGPEGVATFDLSSVSRRHVLDHVEAERPFELRRVVAFGEDDFLRGTDLALKYAQSYTLVHFLLYGDSGRHRERFMDFLRSAWVGKSSPSHVWEALEVEDRDDFQEAWFAGVRTLAAGL